MPLGECLRRSPSGSTDSGGGWNSLSKFSRHKCKGLDLCTMEDWKINPKLIIWTRGKQYCGLFLYLFRAVETDRRGPSTSQNSHTRYAVSCPLLIWYMIECVNLTDRPIHTTGKHPKSSACESATITREICLIDLHKSYKMEILRLSSPVIDLHQINSSPSTLRLVRIRA
jgi:hypothetical protein